MNDLELVVEERLEEEAEVRFEEEAEAEDDNAKRKKLIVVQV